MSEKAKAPVGARRKMKRDPLPMRFLNAMRAALQEVDAASDVHDMPGDSTLEKARAYVDACGALGWVETEIRRRKWNATPDCTACGAKCEGQKGLGYICECGGDCASMH